MKVVQVIFVCLIVLLSLPEIIIGLIPMRVYTSAWSVRYDYLAAISIPLMIGVPALLLAGVAAFRLGRRSTWVPLVLAVGIMIAGAIVLPQWLLFTMWATTDIASEADEVTAQRMRDLRAAVESWAGKEGAYPRNQTEMNLALQSASFEFASPFQHRSQRLNYEIVTTGNATGPVLREDRPALLSYTVNAEGTHYWITGTGLPSAFADNAFLLRDGRGGPPLVYENSLKARVGGK
jgi:hypothetical protein